jgi:hypothetical protein
MVMSRGTITCAVKSARIGMSSVSPRMLAVKRDELSAALDAQPVDKREANAILRQMVSAITVDYDAGELVIEWAHGGSSDVVYSMPPPTKREAKTLSALPRSSQGGPEALLKVAEPVSYPETIDTAFRKALGIG